MTRLPPYLYVDQRGPEEDDAREALDAEPITAFGDREEIERLHRVLYPVYRVEFSYETGEGVLLGTEQRDEAMLLDGLWADNDRAVSQYVENTSDLVRTATDDYDLGPGLGSTVLLEFQAPADEAASLLPERVQEYRREADGGSPNVYLRELRETYGLPGDFEPEGFESVGEVERCYLPFWLAEMTAEGADNTAVVTVRDADFDVEHFWIHAWLAGFVSEDPDAWPSTATRSTSSACSVGSAASGAVRRPARGTVGSLAANTPTAAGILPKSSPVTLPRPPTARSSSPTAWT